MRKSDDSAIIRTDFPHLQWSRVYKDAEIVARILRELGFENIFNGAASIKMRKCFENKVRKNALNDLQWSRVYKDAEI